MEIMASYFWRLVINIVLIQTLVVVNDATINNPCDQGYTKAGSSCIRFINRRMLSWKEARAECAAYSATLMMFTIADDIKAFAAVAKKQSVDGWWSRLTSQNHAGVWTWGNEEYVGPHSIVWNQEPDDVKHVENCVSVNYMGNASDDTCSLRLGYICKAATVNDGCDDGWSMSGNWCYYVSDTSDSSELLSWRLALSKCTRKSSASLVDFQTSEEFQGVVRILGNAYNMGYRWWTGLNDRSHEGQWAWVNKAKVDMSVIQWERLPSSLQKTEKCGIVHSNGHISYGHCDRANNFICRYQIRTAEVVLKESLGCSGIWLRAGHKCYLFNTNSSMTRKYSIDYCAHRGGRLLKVESLDEMRWLSMETRYTRANSFWTGLLRSPTNLWQWDDGASVNMKLIPWRLQPDNLMGEQNCAIISRNMQYRDVSCFSRAAYVCEVQTEDAPCKTGWLVRNAGGITTCYYVSDTTLASQVSWQEARELCRKLSGVDEASLLAVNDVTERTYLAPILRAKGSSSVGWWTDLTDAGHEGLWTYADTWNTPPNQTDINWSHEPNNMGGNENCAVMYYGGQYNDVACDVRASVACEKMAAIPSTPASTTASSVSAPSQWTSHQPSASSRPTSEVVLYGTVVLATTLAWLQ